MQRLRASAITMSAILILMPGCATTNSTAKSGRGKPSLDVLTSPSAWIHIDSHAGEYRNDADGNPLTPWYISTPVSASPTFRVEVFKPLLGDAVDFQCVIQSQDMSDKAGAVAYGIKANDGTFEIGREYPLLSPGENFVLRKAATKDILTEAKPLPAGDYLLAATLTNRENGNSTVAISHFTVAATPAN